MLEDVEADATVGVDVRVKHFGQELHLGRLVRVVLGKLNC